jgi:hypothetical protein
MMQSIDISGFNSGAQKKNKKPFLLVDDAFQELKNAYVWREEVKKREGMQFIGRFRRVFSAASIGNSGASPWTINTLYSTYVPAIVSEATAEIEPGSVIITIGAITFTDQGNGLLTGSVVGNSGWIDYLTGIVTLTHTAGAGVASTASLNYYPTLPAMGIWVREIPGINDEETIWFDTKYAYKVVGGDFQEFLTPSVTWDGTDSDFFWCTNYSGSDSSRRLFFETNFTLSAGSPMRYTDGITWTTFQPIVAAALPTYLFTARILIPYYGRLLALNTYEGDNIGTARNFFSRCRFSQIGSPVQADAWQSDIFGKGGFIDAPTNEEIISATFYKNTLIVQFERSTWRLQYVGEYGIPFLWERISSDFGSESTFSTVLFDNGVLAVADKAIVVSSGGDVKRIDLDIPDLVYDFLNSDNGVKRVQGIRDFKKEIVYWCYPNFNTLYTGQYFPNETVIYNYRNNTYAFFRNNVTCYGNFQYDVNITWDRLDVYWDSYQVGWDDVGQAKLPLIVSGNQQGFGHFYGYPDVEALADSSIDALDQESLSVTAVTVGVDVVLTIKNHNLQNDEIIYLTGLNYVVTTSPATLGSTTLNDQIYMVQIVDLNNVRLFKWDQTQKQFYTNFTVTNVGDYVGGGLVALFPRVYIQTKDFNPAKQIGQNILCNSIDFLFDATVPAPMNVQLQMNTKLAVQANVLDDLTNRFIGNQNIEQSNSKTGYVQNVTTGIGANPCVITSTQHGLLNNDEVSFQQIGGTTNLNGINYVVTFIDVNNFSIGVDATGYTAYTQGGYWVQSKQQYYTLSSKYAWHRFFANAYGQYMSVVITNNDEQMAQLSTHQQNFVLNAMKISFRPAGTNIFGK